MITHEVQRVFLALLRKNAKNSPFLSTGCCSVLGCRFARMLHAKIEDKTSEIPQSVESPSSSVTESEQHKSVSVNTL